MFDERFSNLQAAGYGGIKLRAMLRTLSEEAINRVLEKTTPPAAAEALREELAAAKAVVEDVNDEEE